MARGRLTPAFPIGDWEWVESASLTLHKLYFFLKERYVLLPEEKRKGDWMDKIQQTATI